MEISRTPAKTRHQAAARVRQFIRTIDAIETDARQKEREAQRNKKWINRLLVLQHIPLLKGK